MDVIDNNKYNSYKKSGKLVKSYFPDTVLFEKYKNLSENERKTVFKELDEYIHKTNSILLTYDGCPDCFNSDKDFYDRFNDSIKIAKRAASYIYYIYLQICAFYTICYILKQTDIKFDAKNKIITRKKESLIPIMICNQIIEGVEKEINLYSELAGELLMDSNRNFNDFKLNIVYANFNIYYCNFLDSSLKIPLIKSFNGKSLKQNNKEYSSEFINNVLNTFFKFVKCEKETNELFCALFKAILNGFAFEFNDIPDLINLSIAKFYDCNIQTIDKKMKVIARYLNIKVV